MNIDILRPAVCTECTYMYIMHTFGILLATKQGSKLVSMCHCLVLGITLDSGRLQVRLSTGHFILLEKHAQVGHLSFQFRALYHASSSGGRK